MKRCTLTDWWWPNKWTAPAGIRLEYGRMPVHFTDGAVSERGHITARRKPDYPQDKREPQRQQCLSRKLSSPGVTEAEQQADARLPVAWPRFAAISSSL